MEKSSGSTTIAYTSMLNSFNIKPKAENPFGSLFLMMRVCSCLLDSVILALPSSTNCGTAPESLLFSPHTHTHTHIQNRFLCCFLSIQLKVRNDQVSRCKLFFFLKKNMLERRTEYTVRFEYESIYKTVIE